MPMRQDFSKYQEGEPPSATVQPADVIISPDTRREQRLPPNQVRTRKWPVLHWKRVPTVATGDWRFWIRGEVETPIDLDWQSYRERPRVTVFSDFHCVTRWSRLGNRWEGVSIQSLLAEVNVRPTAKFAIVHGYDDGFTTNLPLVDLDVEDALLADTHDGEALSADHGGPVRLIVPRLYAWKSAKWVAGIELVTTDAPGTWERSGYHLHGDPWLEERRSW